MTKLDYTREDLIALAEAAMLPQELWVKSDAASAQRQTGELLSLLKAGCDFTILHRNAIGLNTDDQTVWVEVTYKGVQDFLAKTAASYTASFYLPTAARLENAGGEDWHDDDDEGLEPLPEGEMTTNDEDYLPEVPTTPAPEEPQEELPAEDEQEAVPESEEPQEAPEGEEAAETNDNEEQEQ